MRTFAIIVALVFGLSALAVYLFGGISRTSENDVSILKPSGSNEFTQITFEEVENHFSHLKPALRQLVLKDNEQFRKMVQAENQRRALLQAAIEHGVDSDSNLAYQKQRVVEDFVVQAYIKQRLREIGLPKGFPTEAQVQQFYDNNQPLFTTSERIPVWQIFWDYTPEMGDKEKVVLQQQAAKVSKSIRSGNKSFASMARQHSQHDVSRLQGGFMGLLKVNELLPGIKEQVLSLKPGEVSGPVVSKQGVHVLLRAETVPSEQRAIASVKGVIIEKLKALYLEQQRQRVRQEAEQAFSLVPDDKAIHLWWQKIQSAATQANVNK